MGKKCRSFLSFEACSCLFLHFSEGFIKRSCPGRRRLKEAISVSFPSFACLFFPKRNNKLCSFSCYLLTGLFPLLWADPVAKWLNHAICGTTVIFLSSSLWCQRLGRITLWQAPGFSKCSSYRQDKAQVLDQTPRSKLAHAQFIGCFVSDFSENKIRLQITCLHE